ncbi:MAG: hypothetical protein ACLP7P_16480 [Rhodomicrobium sp.]
MHSKTLELIRFVKKSAARNKPGLEHFAALAKDAHSLGESALMAEIKDELARKMPANGGGTRPTPSPTELKIADLQKATKFAKNRGDFIIHLVEQVKLSHKHIRHANPRLSLPKLIQHYNGVISSDELVAAAREVAKKYSATH